MGADYNFAEESLRRARGLCLRNRTLHLKAAIAGVQNLVSAPKTLRQSCIPLQSHHLRKQRRHNLCCKKAYRLRADRRFAEDHRRREGATRGSIGGTVSHRKHGCGEWLYQKSLCVERMGADISELGEAGEAALKASRGSGLADEQHSLGP